MGDIDLKDVIKDAITGVLDDMKDNFSDYVDSKIIPAIDDASTDFKAHLTEEASATASVWVKVRNALLSVITSIAVAFIKKLLENMKEEK